MGDGRIEVGEEVVLVREPVEGTDLTQEAEVVGTRTLEQHGHPAALQFVDDVTERLRAGGVEHLEIGEPQDHHLHAVHRGQFGEEPLAGEEVPIPAEYSDPLLRYFAGQRERFAGVRLDLHGTAFQLAVWNALCAIPYGEVRSYAAIANAVGSPRATRAVGGANGLNPVPIIVPCHRVVEASMRLGGFSSGLPRKRTLLAIEGVQVQSDIVHPGQLSLI